MLLPICGLGDIAMVQIFVDEDPCPRERELFLQCKVVCKVGIDMKLKAT